MHGKPGEFEHRGILSAGFPAACCPSSVGFKLSHFQNKNQCPATVMSYSLTPQHTLSAAMWGVHRSFWSLDPSHGNGAALNLWGEGSEQPWPHSTALCVAFPAVSSAWLCFPGSCSGLNILNWEQFHRALETQFWELSNSQDFFSHSPYYKQTKPLHCSNC